MSIATQGPTTVSVEIAGREITFETGKLAKQADGAVVVREGDTEVLATAQGRGGGARARGDIGGVKITFETGKLAKQADGAVVVREGDTEVLATAQGKAEAA